jgi:hypothetical protein
MLTPSLRPIEDIYDDEVDAVVVHGDDIDGLQAHQWDVSECLPRFSSRPPSDNSCFASSEQT